MKVVLTGAMGAGKSTVVRAAMQRLGWKTPAGYFTRWGPPARSLVLETWAGAAYPVARPVTPPAGSGKLPYELDEALFGRIAMASLSADSGRPVVLDELGVLEIGLESLVRKLAEIFHGPAPVLAVIQQRALAAWQARLDFESSAEVWTVELATRAALPGRLAARFQA